MPRFSDVFTYQTCEVLDDNRTKFEVCHLLKTVNEHKVRTKFESITLDMSGMFLFFENHCVTHGPYPLTTAD